MSSDIHIHVPKCIRSLRIWMEKRPFEFVIRDKDAANCDVHSAVSHDLNDSSAIAPTLIVSSLFGDIVLLARQTTNDSQRCRLTHMDH